MTRPDLNTVPQFYKGYVEYVKDLDMIEAQVISGKLMLELLSTIPEDKGTFKYQPEKWSIKELLCHMMDAERIFAYRALRFARNDKTPLSGFEEKDYASEANAHGRTIQQLSNEIKQLRATTIDMFASFTPQMLSRTGTANNVELSVLNLGYIVAGHESHHRKVLTERYLK
jgi:hypothetical protein